jgi:hypothetical protein
VHITLWGEIELKRVAVDLAIEVCFFGVSGQGSTDCELGVADFRGGDSEFGSDGIGRSTGVLHYEYMNRY